jgi:hypothetical protein
MRRCDSRTELKSQDGGWLWELSIVGVDFGREASNLGKDTLSESTRGGLSARGFNSPFNFYGDISSHPIRFLEYPAITFNLAYRRAWYSLNRGFAAADRT